MTWNAPPGAFPRTLIYEMDYKRAVDKSRHWWNCHTDLPWWRPLAKRRALRCSEAWGELAKALHTDALLNSNDAQPQDHPPLDH